MTFFKIGTTAQTYDKVLIIVGTVIGFLFGGWNQLFTALLMLHGVDLLTGILVGGKRKNINSKTMSAGIKKKVGGWLGIILAHVIDTVLFDGQLIAVTGLTFALIGNEGLSIAENLAVLGVPIPEYITRHLEQIRDNGETETKK